MASTATGSLSLSLSERQIPEKSVVKKDVKDMERVYGESTDRRILREGERNDDYLAQRRLFANTAHRG